LAALASLCADRGVWPRPNTYSTKVVTTTMGFRRFRWLGAAHRRLPDYAPAQGHLAEVEAALGETDSAIARLRPLTITSDDLDYAAQLARILSEVGRVEEAREWRARTAARYDELLARHPEAFADHAAEFWLQAGADPHRALSLATMNLEVRRTPRAHELLFRASSAVEGARPGSLIPHRDGA
jgi:tetratricopeptide (TPR) repeat protein